MRCPTDTYPGRLPYAFGAAGPARSTPRHTIRRASQLAMHDQGVDQAEAGMSERLG